MSTMTTVHLGSRWRQFYALTKPRVVQLIVFCALIGMVLAVPGLPTLADSRRLGSRSDPSTLGRPAGDPAYETARTGGAR
jgi:hypothetical protein